jgi:SAM-dependent methyltransferase
VKICTICSSRYESEGSTCPQCGASPDKQKWITPEGADPEPSGFRTESFDLLEAVEGDSFWFKGRNKLIFWALDRYFPNAKSLLEVGCGTGYVLSGISRHRPEIALTGVEPYAKGLEIARRRVPEATLMQLDGRRLPFEAHFDIVSAFDVLEHVVDDDRLVAELARAVRPGGGAVVTVPQHPWLWSAVDEFSEHKRRYRLAELKGLLAGAGFRVLRTTSFVSLLLPAVAISRWTQRYRRFDPLGEYRAGRRLNQALGSTLEVERNLIRAGVSLPVGSSILAIAVRDVGASQG